MNDKSSQANYNKSEDTANWSRISTGQPGWTMKRRIQQMSLPGQPDQG